MIEFTCAQVYNEINREVQQFYFNNNAKTNVTEALRQVNQYATDSLFTYAIDLYARINANKSTADTYFFRYDDFVDLI